MKHHTSNRIYNTVEPLFYLSLENSVRMVMTVYSFVSR